jgi:hypothetical protein
MNRLTIIALASLALLFGIQAGACAQTTINFLPAGEGDWGADENWSDPNMLGAHVPRSSFDEIVTMSSGGTAVVTGAFTDVTDPDGPASININSGTLQIQTSGELKAFSSFGSPGADGHVTANGTLNIQGGGKLTATTLSFGQFSIFDVDVTSATTSPVTADSVTISSGAKLALDYSGLATPLGKRTVITTTTGFVNGSFSNNVVTGLDVAQRALVNIEGQGKMLTANVVNVPTVSIDRQSGVATITNTHSTPIPLDGIAFRSPLGAFNAAVFTGLGSGWTTPPNNSSTVVGQAYEGTSVGSPTDSLGPGASIQIAGMGFFTTPNPTSFLQETEDVVVEVTSPTIGATPATAAVNYTGDKVVNNNIVLAIDSSGHARVQNVTNFSQEVDAYRISSTGSPLQQGTWSTFQSQEIDDGTWLTSAQSSSSALIEAQEDGTTTFAKSNIYDLGTILNTGFTPSGITFEYLRAGQNEFTTGVVVFGSLPDVAPDFGDFNGDGLVNAADYTVWRNHLGAPEGSLLSNNGNGDVIDETDYDLWKTNFGNVYSAGSGGGAGLVSAVPEPSSMALLCLVVGLTFVAGRRNF